MSGVLKFCFRTKPKPENDSRANGILRSSGVYPVRSNYLADDEYRQLQSQLASIPELGDLMPGTGGFRKLRWADPRRGKGRRGGLRIIYYHFVAERQIWLMTLYDKDEAADLTPKEKKALKSAVGAEGQARQASRLAREKRLRRIR